VHARVEEEHVTEVEKLAALVGETSKVLVDLGLPPPPHSGDSPGPDESSGGPKGGRHHLGVPTRGTWLRCQSLGLIIDRPPCPWPQAISLVVSSFWYICVCVCVCVY
jgi:hypothetical protein